MPEGRIAVADCRSVVLQGAGDMGIDLLPAMERSLKHDGYDVVLVVDDDLLVRIDLSEFGYLPEATLKQVPARAAAPAILDLADRANARVVSNDTFEAYRSKYPWVVERRIPYRIFDGEIYLDPEELMGVF
jgi:hypothetical protein